MLLLFLCPDVGARTWRVEADGSGDAATIQAAIDAAGAQDSIIVGPGTYDENLDTNQKELFLIGEHGADVTVIDGGYRASVLRFTGGGLIEGFTIRRGKAFRGGGLYIAGPVRQPLIRTIVRLNIVEDNTAGLVLDSGQGGGLYMGQTGVALVESNVIRNNTSGDEGGGIFDDGALTFMDFNEIRNNVISGNTSHIAGGGISINNLTGIIADNLVVGNVSEHFGGGVLIHGGTPEIKNNTIIGNVVGNESPSGAGIHLVGSPLISHNIVASNHRLGLLGGGSGVGVYCASRATPTVNCNNIWGNDIDAIGPCAPTIEQLNFSLDPEFCSVVPEESMNFMLQSDSPCTPGNNPNGSSCGLIGARPIGCETVSIERRSWSAIKRLYR